MDIFSRPTAGDQKTLLILIYDIKFGIVGVILTEFVTYLCVSMHIICTISDNYFFILGKFSKFGGWSLNFFGKGGGS